MAPPGVELPYIVEPACPGEGCTFGRWLACDSIPLYRAPGEAGASGGYLSPDQSFEVTSGAVVVDVPGVIVVTRPVRQRMISSDSILFAPGDTLYVLDYVGEGFFHAWHADSVLEIEVFWPWEPFYAGPEYEYGGEVVQERSASFWVETPQSPSAPSWVWVDRSALAAPNLISAFEPTCPL